MADMNFFDMLKQMERKPIREEKLPDGTKLSDCCSDKELYWFELSRLASRQLSQGLLWRKYGFFECTRCHEDYFKTDTIDPLRNWGLHMLLEHFEALGFFEVKWGHGYTKPLRSHLFA
jgi:hypothetical protein